MPTISYRYSHAPARTVEVGPGTSVMRAALEHDVPGIVGECGGQAMCATCHIYVDDSTGLPTVGDDEDEMLDCTAAPRDPGRSRLGCQLTAGTDFDTIVVDVPERQV